MPFDPVDPRQNFPALERGIQKYWQEEDIFKRSIHLRTARNGSHKGDVLNGMAGTDKEERFSFYDGPPFATGLPHYGHLLAGTIKDVIPRYQTMRGKRVERRFGWDCHGLPIENIIEKEHHIRSKQEIEKMGVKAFNDLCRTAVQRYTKEWRVVVERMGRWVDMDWDYRTMDPDFMESIWWVFKSLAEKELIYEGWKAMHICPRCATPLSNFEVTQGYKDRTDMSVFATFPLVDDPQMILLAWTTTPWSLPGNMWLAVGKDINYVTVKREGDDHTYVVAENLVSKVFRKTPHEITGQIKAKDLIGKRYQPLFPYFIDRVIPSSEKSGKPKTYGEKVFKVISYPDVEVSADEGTGIVHITSSVGGDSYAIATKEGVDVSHHLGIDGNFFDFVTDFRGLNAKPEGKDPMSTDKVVIEYLKKHERSFLAEPYKHSYPHCWRCDTPLLPYTTASWFVAVEKIKQKMLAANKKTRWVPEHLRDGRFGRWLEGAHDWAISRNRYWGTPLPIWRCKDSGEMDVIGSRDDLMKQVQIRFTKVTVLRHAESDGNVTPRYQGKIPGSDLTSNGKAQAKATADGLKTSNVTRIYCSPLARTRQTAEAISKTTGAEVIVDERLREVEFGDFEGKSVDFSDLTFVKARRSHKLETGKVESIYHFPGMETWSQVSTRVHSFMDEMLPRHRGEHIVIVTHADPALNFKNFFTQEDPAKLCNQPYPNFASPSSYFWDHDTQKALDLHKETVDDIVWPSQSGKPLVNLTLVRHGQTDWNRDGICQGQEGESRLTDLGREQAKKIAAGLKKKHFDCIVSSDLDRAHETASIIAAALDLPIVEASDLYRERAQGEWVGKKLTDVMKKHPPLIDSGEFGVHHETPAGGESLSQFLARADRARRHLLKTYPGKKVLLITHGGFIQALSAVTLNLTYLDALKKAPENCETIDLPLHPLLQRIPEVLDCWFESGSMPYAQSHYPFSYGFRVSGYEKSRNPKPETRNPLPPGFPADFIAEGIDQTRGWFYTLTVLSTALFDHPAFMNCVVNGTVLAEDGKKMSKRLKNYPEPLEVVEKHGADAVRFALMSSPAVRGEDLRFSERYVEETVRSVLLPLWNTYAFFVTYANAAKWQPITTRRSSNHPLDQWIRAEVQDLVNRMTTQLDGYDLSATCAELNDTIDALTNWYVRLSRRRFAGKAGLHTTAEAMEEMNEEDRLNALSTLYEVLLTLCQLLAPFCPFITEDIYLNLVPEDHGSIHLTDWPESRKLNSIELKLLRKTRILRGIASLGLKIRSEKKIKLRQPLAKATIAVPPALLQGDTLESGDLQLLQEELNVLTIDLVPDPGMIAEVYAQVDARKVGPRLGGRVQEIIQAGKRGDFIVNDDGSMVILDEVIGPDEVTVMYRGKEGQDVTADRGIVVALDTRMTPELTLQGKARDLIRAIQQWRKESGLQPEDKILLSIEGAEDVMNAHGKTVLEATQGMMGKAEGEERVVELDEATVKVKFMKI